MVQYQELTILLVADRAEDRDAIINYGKRSRHLSIRFDIVERLEAVFTFLKTMEPDLILFDLNVPDSKGLESVRNVCDTYHQVPVVVLTPMLNLEDGLESIRYGAQDYLVKGKISEEILERVIRYALERHQSKREIRDANLKLQGILDSMTSRIALIDGSRKVVWANRTAYEEASTIKKDQKAIRCHDILYKGKKACDVCPVDHAFKTGEKQIKTCTDQEGRSYRVVAIPIVNDLGKVINVVEIVDEITERLSLENQLRQAQKMESLGTLAGGIAHDFNNILAAIMGFTELGLMRDTIDDTTREYLMEINDASLRATDLVRQILTFSRQVEQEPKPLMVQLVVNEALKLLRSTLPSSIEIQTDIQKHTRLVIADPTHIHQVIMNLSTNAMHAMEPEGGLLIVEIHETEVLEDNAVEGELMPGTYLKIRVKDTGCGIEVADIERIFDPYFTTKDIGEGTGLGLSVVHGIIEDCGGKIYVKSSAETGTSFTIYLPTVESSAAELVEEQEAILPRGQEHILVVDDEPFIRKLCKSILIKQGYRITTANNGKEALELFKTEPDTYDLVLSDVMMPKLRGESLAKQLLKLKPEQPIMLMTGYAEKLRRDELLGHGVMGLLQKPITRRTLICEVRGVLDRTAKESV